MKTRSSQFEVRENTASPRQHDLRYVTQPGSNELSSVEVHELQPRAVQNNLSLTDLVSTRHAAAGSAATGVERRGENHLLTVQEVAELLQVPVSWVYERVRKRSLERLPGYRLGKYWRFREAEVLTWVERQRVGAHRNA